MLYFLLQIELQARILLLSTDTYKIWCIPTVTPMDYGGFSETLTFDTCETRCCVNVSIVEDLVDEPDEIFNYNLEPTASGLDSRIIITPDMGEVVINDNDGKKVKMLCVLLGYFSLDFTINCWLSMTSLLISQ